MTIHVFAYGSNLHLKRLRRRTPSAQLVTLGRLPGHELRFHKRGRDGSAKADAFHTGGSQHSVWGAVFRLHAGDKAELDRCESLGTGYDEAQLEVLLPHGDKLKAWTYRARGEMIAEGLKPFCWYKQYVLAGAEWHGFPAEYVSRIEAVAHRVDQDQRRLAEHRLVLGDLASLSLHGGEKAARQGAS